MNIPYFKFSVFCPTNSLHHVSKFVSHHGHVVHDPVTVIYHGVVLTVSYPRKHSRTQVHVSVTGIYYGIVWPACEEQSIKFVSSFQPEMKCVPHQHIQCGSTTSFLSNDVCSGVKYTCSFWKKNQHHGLELVVKMWVF